MRRTEWLLGGVVPVLLATGCFRVAATDATLASGERHALWNHTFLWGLAGEPEMDVRRVCGTPAARVETGETVVTLAVTVVTLGVYTPRESTVTCGAAPAPAQGSSRP